MNKKGKIVEIFHNKDCKVTEGWAMLIEKKGEPLTYIPSNMEESDTMEIDYEVYISQKWLVEWVSPQATKKVKWTPSTRITQKTLSGTKSVRSVYSYLGKWSEIKKNKNYIDNRSTILQSRDTTIEDRDHYLY